MRQRQCRAAGWYANRRTRTALWAIAWGGLLAYGFCKWSLLFRCLLPLIWGRH